MRRVLILLLWAAVACAEDLGLETLDVDDARKKKHHLLFGGLRGLSKFLSIKIKVILSVVSIAVVVVLVIKALGAFKLFGLGGCPEPIILTHETPTFYSSEPHHAHHHDHPFPDHHDHHFSPDDYSGPVYTEYPSSPGGGGGSFPYPPSSKRTDMAGGRQISQIDIGDLAFRVLGVNTDACRRRFVCEMDERAKTSFLLKFAFGIMSRGLFEKYRDYDNKPVNYEDCARLNPDCYGDNVFHTTFTPPTQQPTEESTSTISYSRNQTESNRNQTTSATTVI